jgi:PAS domain S-box-containing protein
VRQITVKNQAIAEALGSGARQNAIFQSAHISSIAFDLSGVVQGFNPGAQRLLGYGAADLTTQLKLSELCEPHDVVQRAVAKRKDLGGTCPADGEGAFELCFRCQDGRRVSVMAFVEVMSNGAAASGPGYLLVLTDNTAHKRSQALQVEAMRSLQKIATQLPGMIYQFRLQPDGRSSFPYTSDAIRDVFRLDPEDVREDASGALNAIHPDDYPRVMAALEKSATDLTPWQQEYRLRFADGEVRWLTGNALPERETDGATHWHGFVTDITERKATENALRLSQSGIRARLNAIPDLMFEIDLLWSLPRIS